MKLGKLAPKFHPKTLMFDKYITGKLPNPAEKVYREYKVPAAGKQMFGNDQYGDCTCAGAANLLILMSCHTEAVVIPTLQEVLDLYTAVSGFNQATGANDNGAAMTDVLDHLRVTGLSGHKIQAWIQINHNNTEHRRLACELFGATYVGVQLPASAQEQFVEDEECHWEIVENSPIEGGHCIVRPGYGSEGDDYVTWSNWDVKASTDWSTAYVDEEYVIVTEDWIDKATKKTPGGVNLDTLLADLKML